MACRDVIWGREHSANRLAGLVVRPRFVALLLVATAFLTGCSGITRVRPDGATVRHYIGYVQVVIPAHAASEGQFEVMEISNYGLRFYNGFGLGSSHEYREYIPLDSKLVVRVQNEKQMNHVLEMLTPILKEGLCVTVAPQ